MVEFARPEFLWALPAAALPVLIHMWNRTRYRTVQWATMDFLRVAERHRRQRMRLKNLLLLAIRVLAVLLLVFMFARPRATTARPGARGVEKTVVLLDDSASMTQTVDGVSLFDRAKRLVGDMAQASRTGSFELWVGSWREPVLGAEDAAQLDEAELGAAIDALRTVGTPLDLDLLTQMGQGSPDGAHFVIVSDLRASDWGAAQPLPPVRSALRSLQEFGPVQIVDVGAAPGPNTGLGDLSGSGRFLYVDRGSLLRVTVHNKRDALLEADVLQVEVDGRLVPSVAAAAVPPGQRVNVPFTVRFSRQGYRALRVALRTPDAFPADDERHACLTVLRDVPVLLVEDEPGAAPYLAAALAPSADSSSLRVERVRSDAAGISVDEYAVVFLYDLRTPALWTEPLRRYVVDGGRVVAFLGAGAEEAAWRASFFSQSRGLIDADLVAQAQVEAGAGLTQLDAAHPLLQPFAGWEAVFATASFARYHALVPGRACESPVRFDDAASTPALLVQRLGEGWVAVFPFALQWTDWARHEVARTTFVSLMQWLVESGTPASDELNLKAGAALSFPLQAGRHRVTGRLLPPDGGEALELVADARADREGLWFTSAPLNRLGVWKLQLERLGGGTDSVPIAVNLPESESRLERTSPAALERLSVRPGQLRVLKAGDAGEGEGLGKARWWRAFAVLALAVLFVESLLAYAFGNPSSDALLWGGSP